MTESIENKIFDVVHAVEPSRDFSERLWKRINSSSRPASAPKAHRRWFWVPAVAVLALALGLVVVTPQAVIAAVRSLIAYLPGIGFVQNEESTLYLPEPISVERDGVSLTIEQVVADTNATVVSYHIDGLPTGTAETSMPCFYDDNRLLLPDGATRLPIGGGVTGSQARVEFQPLPDGVTSATLLAAMNFPDPACTAPKEWRVEFTLGTAIPETEMMPVIDNLDSQPTPPIATNDAASVPNTLVVENNVQFIIDRIVLLENGYLIHGYGKWTNKDWLNVRMDQSTAYALDADGEKILLEPSDEGSNDNEFAFKVLTKEFKTPLTLNVQNLLIWAHIENSPTFSFDAGDDPQIGQSWDINKELEVAGQKIDILRASVVQETGSSGPGITLKGYAIETNSSADINAFIWCTGTGEKESSGGGGSTRELDNHHKLMEMYYPDGLPYGQITCSFKDMQFLLPGSWQLEWQPPAGEQ